MRCTTVAGGIKQPDPVTSMMTGTVISRVTIGLQKGETFLKCFL
jgi:hypothetical protein